MLRGKASHDLGALLIVIHAVRVGLDKAVHGTWSTLRRRSAPRITIDLSGSPINGVVRGHLNVYSLIVHGYCCRAGILGVHVVGTASGVWQAPLHLV
jgi:hypothetical protein